MKEEVRERELGDEEGKGKKSTGQIEVIGGGNREIKMEEEDGEREAQGQEG